MLDPVLDHLWQSTLVVLAAGMLSFALRRQGAQLRYWVWFGASLKFLVPFAALMALGTQLSWLSAELISPHNAQWRDVALQVIQPMAALRGEQDSVGPGPSPAGSEGTNPAGSPSETSSASQGGMATVAQAGTAARFAPERQAPGVQAARFSDRLAAWLPATALAVWLLGSLTIAAIWTLKWTRLSQLARRAKPCALGTGEADSLEVRTIAAGIEPGVFGILRPVLLLPEGIVDRLSPAQLDAIIRHERWHVLRRDNLTALVQMIVAALFWFHPLVWWVGTKLVAERERACDEAVLASGVHPNTYASGILEVCSFYLDSPLPCASGVGGGSLKQRMRWIAANRRTRALGAARKTLLMSLPGIALVAPFWMGVWTSTTANAQVDDSRDQNEVVQDFLARRAYFAELGPLIGGPATDYGETKLVIRLTECEEAASATTSSEPSDIGPTPGIESVQSLIAYAFDVEDDQVVLPEDLQALGLLSATSEEQRIDHTTCRGLVRRSLQEDYGLVARIESDEVQVVVDNLDWPGAPPEPVVLTALGLDVDPDILDGYTGFFARPNSESTFLTPIFEVRRDGRTLLIEWNGEEIDLAATSQTDFSAPEYFAPGFRERYASRGLTGQPTIYGRATLSNGRSINFVRDQPTFDFRFESNDELSIFNDYEKRNWLTDPIGLAHRIDTDVAEAALAELEQRRAQTLPDPESEALIQAIVDNLRTSDADDGSTVANAASSIREHLERIAPGLVDRLGDPRTVSLREVLPSGRDVYDVVFDWIALRATVVTNSEGKAVPLTFHIDCRRRNERDIERFGGCTPR
jgi:beta-lactamase regulating signal transducer with metallopeptidase domain